MASSTISFDDVVCRIKHPYGSQDYILKDICDVMSQHNGWNTMGAYVKTENRHLGVYTIPKLEKAEKEIAELKTELTNTKADLLAAEENERKTREEQKELQAENERQKEELASLKAELDALKKKQKEDAERPFFQKLRSIF